MPTTRPLKADDEVSNPIVSGELAGLIEALDWTSTPIGPIGSWPAVVRMTIRIMLASAMPMCLLIGRKGVMIYNDAYRDIAGARHPACLGTSVFDSWPEVAQFNRTVIDRIFEGETLTYEDQELVLWRNGAAERVWLELDYSPLLDDDGEAVGAFAILAETTKRVRAEKALARSEERLSLALEASGIVGAWELDLTSRIVTADARFAEMFGVGLAEAEQGISAEGFFRRIHPADRDFVARKTDEAIANRGGFRAEYRLVDDDGGIRWVLATGKFFETVGGNPRLPGVVIDITERKAVEAALAASEAGFRTLADTMPQMVWSTRPDGFHDYYNARWYEFTGMPLGSTDGEAWAGMFHPDDQDRAWELWRHSLATGEPYQIEYRLRHANGEYRWTLGRALAIRNEAGEIIRWFGTCTDIHETKQVAEEREIVAHELSHRIKNIFSVLNGIISLSARSHPDIKPLADQLRQRISAMGKAHDFVRPHSRASRPQNNQSSLRALVELLLAPHVGDDSGRFTFHGDDATIDDGAATPLALLFHELATNAAKYGALAEADGRVVIDAVLSGDKYRMVWKETGGAPVSGPPADEGFGSRLITLSVQGQLGGTLQRRWKADGLEVELTMPAAQLSRSATLRR